MLSFHLFSYLFPYFMNPETPSFTQEAPCIDKAYERGLYDINPINKTLNRRTLSLAYSPGVGYVCKEIEAEPALINTLTLRGRSVAVVTQGNMFPENPIEPGRMMPIVDWCIAQIKFYSEVDAYPFILRKEANVVNALKDIANSYACILLLDDIKIEEESLPSDAAVLYHSQVRKLSGREVSDCELTSHVLAYLLKEKKVGLTKEDEIKKGIKERPEVFKQDESYFFKLRDGKSMAEHARALHQHFNGTPILI